MILYITIDQYIPEFRSNNWSTSQQLACKYSISKQISYNQVFGHNKTSLSEKKNGPILWKFLTCIVNSVCVCTDALKYE